jgi:hypothetical protein
VEAAVEELTSSLVSIYLAALIAFLVASVALGLGGLGISALLSLITRPGARRGDV